MERKRVGGRFAREDTTRETNPETKPPRRRSRHARVTAQARKTLQEAIPAVAKTLVEEAKKGAIPHMKLLLQLLGLEDGGLTPKLRGQRENSLEEILTEQWNKEP